VNIATLHYYLPGKQKLVEGLSHFMSAKFVTLHGLTPKPSGLPALDHLRQEFADGRLYSGRIWICFSSRRSSSCDAARSGSEMMQIGLRPRDLVGRPGEIGSVGPHAHAWRFSHGSEPRL
jgi:hypothetical protein